MDFKEWFTNQFGEVPKDSLMDIQHEIEALQFKLRTLKEKRHKIQEMNALWRASMYAWNASKRNPSESMLSTKNVIETLFPKEKVST